MQYRILKILSFCVCMLPHKALLYIGKVLGILYFRCIAKERNRAIKQMRASLDNSESEAAELVKKSFINMGQSFLEILYTPRLNKANINDFVAPEGLEKVKNALAEGHGVVLLTGHVGNWEWLAASLAFNGMPTTTIVKPQPNSQHTRILNEYREMVGVEVFARGTSELLAAARALKKGKILGFLADQDAGPGGAFIKFLGRTASTPLGPAVFAHKFSSPVIPMFIVRRNDGKHRLIVGNVMRYKDSGNIDDDLLTFTREMTAFVEKVIRENPTQWLWFQKRWNTKPNEQKIKHHVSGRR
ncbi:lysophospholipid acyltransferase family protein [Pectinatus sottacetonis]|uniref:lysophospholipid acyltransferase family protein n=1 Tax=Pectinatus sottacetonis TaxID=1002795 RepID=UPI001E5110BE|nr:lysophospholipid acyltransferase family protein [Pectinatus sottacetonis]